jgi:hypothetical protein
MILTAIILSAVGLTGSAVSLTISVIISRRRQAKASE